MHFTFTALGRCFYPFISLICTTEQFRVKGLAQGPISGSLALLGVLISWPWTDELTIFWSAVQHLNHCPQCRALDSQPLNPFSVIFGLTVVSLTRPLLSLMQSFERHLVQAVNEWSDTASSELSHQCSVGYQTLGHYLVAFSYLVHVYSFIFYFLRMLPDLSFMFTVWQMVLELRRCLIQKRWNL